MSGSRRRPCFQLLVAALCLVFLAGCTAAGEATEPAPAPAPAPQASPTGDFLTADEPCTRPADRDGVDVRGESADAELWMSTSVAPAGETSKIIIRMTGEGDLRLWAEGPGVPRGEPDGVDPHTGSNWDRPGSEWGTYWVFPRPGCWRIHASRDEAAGTLWLWVRG